MTQIALTAFHGRMVAFDGKQIVFSASFLIPDDQKASLDVPVPGASNPLKLTALFTKTDPPEPPTSAFKSEEGIVNFTFRNWLASTGTLVAKPEKFANFGTQKVYIQVAHHRIADLNLTHLFILIGD